jgi:protein TonB
MFGTLIESRRTLQRSTGGSVVSFLTHGALITSAVLATKTVQMALPVEPVQRVAFFEPANPSLRKAPAHANRRSRGASVAIVPLIRVPLSLPTDVAVGDVLVTTPSTDFADPRPHQNYCGVVCTAPTHGDGGVTNWSSAEAQMQLREAPIPPRYPERLRLAGIEGSVVVKFVVDTVGRVDPASVEIITSTHDLFTSAVREALTRLRFYPATVDNRKVRAAAIMPFQFMLR